MDEAIRYGQPALDLRGAKACRNPPRFAVTRQAGLPSDCGIDIVELMWRYFSATNGLTARYGHDQRMLGLMLWPLIRSHSAVHDKYYRLAGVDTVALADPQSRCGAGHQNVPTVLKEAEALAVASDARPYGNRWHADCQARRSSASSGERCRNRGQ
jgi:hypothetical protein